MRDRLILLAVVVFVAAASATLFLLNYERVEIDERGPASPLVQSNSFYGFQKFLERYDIESQRLSSLNLGAQMPDYSDTLVVGFEAVYLNDTENVKIAEWVSAGGHLVLPLPYRTEDSLLAYFNIHSGAETDEEDSEEDSEEEIAVIPDSQSSNTIFTPDGDELEANLPTRFVYDASFNGVPFGEFSVSYGVYDDLYSNRETQWTLDLKRKEFDGPEDTRTYALGFQYGLGTISLLSDYEHWDNDNFYQRDNSLLSLAALSRVRDPGKIWFVQTIRQTSLMELLWSRAAHLILWLGLTVALFFWWAGQRIGRVQPDPTLERREFNEHLIASGRFLWSNNQRQKLLDSAQEALLNHARRRYPRLHTLNTKQTELQLKDILDDNYSTWTYAMQPIAPTTKPEFSEQIKAIQKLWKLL